jgi:hypothetical protein
MASELLLGEALVSRLFEHGDMVKLTDRFAAALVAGKHVVDWTARRGVVYRSNDHEVFVIWQGRRTAEPLPVKAVEKATRATADVSSLQPGRRRVCHNALRYAEVIVLHCAGGDPSGQPTVVQTVNLEQ